MSRKDILSRQPDDFGAFADHDLGNEWKPASQFISQLCAAYRLPNDERASGADVDGMKMPQAFREARRSEGSVTADVDAPEQNYECHEVVPAFVTAEIIKGECLRCAEAARPTWAARIAQTIAATARV
jgi:hypothetical protein